MRKTLLAAVGAAFLFTAPASASDTPPKEILNVSYDIARELYAAINPKFQAYWKEKTGQDINIKQSHAGSSKQARAIMQGLKADVVTFNQVLDVQVLADRGGFVSKSWQQDLPNNASPYYSSPPSLCEMATPKASRTGAIWCAMT